MFCPDSPELFFLLLGVEFLAGSLMFSFWIGKASQKDIRSTRDGNPGATNLWRALGWRYGLCGLALDYAKGFVPLVFIVHLELLSGWQLAITSVAPILGHAFSPFLKFSGGKAVAVTFGIWSALTLWEAPVLMGTVFTLFHVWKTARRMPSSSPEEDALRVIVGVSILGAYSFLRGIPSLWAAWLFNLLIILFTHRIELRKLISFSNTSE